jgi:hypothetical protein
MQAFSLSQWLKPLKSRLIRAPTRPLGLSKLAQLPVKSLPRFVQECPVALKCLSLLGLIDWSRFPERLDQRFAPDVPPLSYACLAAAYLVKIDQQLVYVADLRVYLREHPALIWVLGFPLRPSSKSAWGFDAEASLPTHRHLSRMLRDLPNACLQYLLDETVRLIEAELAGVLSPDCRFGDCVSLDTKHIIAWVKENNPKAYIEGRRYDKTQQPAGDPDCKLGCKRKHNQRKKTESVEAIPTPTKDALPAKHLRPDEYYWGYGSGVVATKVPEWGEFVLAELTQTFDQPDVSYFQSLMAQVERRLGRKPSWGAFDAAFDAFYVYEYFDPAKGFAAVPFVERGGASQRQFAEDGSPKCIAGLPMHLRYTFWCKTTLIPHQRARYVCPLYYPEKTADTCPANDEHWAKKGCVTTLAASIGARLRYQIDRSSQQFKDVLKQRTATERINSQAVDLGIERPKLRNQASIANHNTLTYVLINLHALQRVRQRKAVSCTAAERKQAHTS